MSWDIEQNSRHFFVALMLSLVADFYTTNKLLGSGGVHTTQIYAEVLMASKAEAVNRLNGRFGTI